jgi:hypothetical protein
MGPSGWCSNRQSDGRDRNSALQIVSFDDRYHRKRCLSMFRCVQYWLSRASEGAVLAYAIGLAVHTRSLIPKLWRAFVYTVISFTGVAAAPLLARNEDQLLPETRLAKQISVTGGRLQNLRVGGDVFLRERTCLRIRRCIRHLESSALAANCGHIFRRYALTANDRIRAWLVS